MSQSVQTFVAVVLGAVLASLGGFAATQIGIRLDRARRAKSAALLCGEILAAVGTLLRLADNAASQGAPLDPVASRMLRAARREIDVYDRNRELLFSLDDADLRARLHGFIVRLSIPLDRIAENQARYAELCSRTPQQLEGLEELRKDMDGAYEFLTQSGQLIPAMLATLQPLAGATFDGYSRIDRDGLTPDGAP